jgi:hypothetical protein
MAAPGSKDVWTALIATILGIAAVIAAIYIPLAAPDHFHWNAIPMIIIYGLGVLLLLPFLGLTRGWRVPGQPTGDEPVAPISPTPTVEPTTWEIRSANTASVFDFLLRNTGSRTAYNVVVGDSNFERELGKIGPKSDGLFTVNNHPAYGVLVTVRWNETDDPSATEFSWTGGPSGPSGH